MHLKVSIHNRAYNSWEFTQDDVKVNIPHLIPSKHKLLHDDIIHFKPAKNSIRTADLYSSWFVTDNNLNPSTKGADLNLHWFKGETIVIVESPFRDAIIPGVLILGKTYGRLGKRLLYKCIPDNKLLPVFLVPYTVDAAFSKVVKNKYIVFRFVDWLSEHPHGEIKDTLGDVDSLEAFNEYQLYRRGLHLSLAPFVKASRSILRDNDPVQKIMDKTNYGIEDLRSIKNIFTIDPADCTDFDDAFSTSEENGVATINVYIANVFVWLETYGLWEHMTERVSTIYLPDKKRPMLPPLLSDDLCSLKQGADRFTFMMSVKYDMQTLAQIGEPVFKNALIHVSKNYTYEDKKLEKNPAYKVLRTLAKTDDSHDVVAFWMIQMNVLAAEHLRDLGKGIFRTSDGENILEKPMFKGEGMSRQALPFGELVLPAVYSDVCAPHSQLGVDAYVHITSPIRRLVDILNQILFQPEVSVLGQTFLDKWTRQLDLVNRTTKDIRKTQMDCELLALAEKNDFLDKEFSGIIFDRNFVSEKYEYAVYLDEIKMFSRIKTDNCIENFTKSQFRIFVFNDEDRLCRKIRLQKIC